MDLHTARSVAVWQDFMLRPSISTVHAAQKPAPQPNFVPRRPRTSVTYNTSYPSFSAWTHREGETDLRVEPTDDQPLAPRRLDGLTEGFVLERVHRAAVDRLDAIELGQDRRERRPVEAEADTHG